MKKKILLVLALILMAGSLGLQGVEASEWVDDKDLGLDEERGTLKFVNGQLQFVGKQAGRRIDIKAAANNVTAQPTKQKIKVDGVPTNFRAYNIKGNNYFMLRDIAYVLKNTKGEFEVEWDNEKRAINTQAGITYTGAGVGFEMKTPHVEEKATKNTSKMYKNGGEVYLLAYVIQGNNYIKLRDLGDEYDFIVKWDSYTQTVIIESEKGREEKERVDKAIAEREAREKRYEEEFERNKAEADAIEKQYEEEYERNKAKTEASLAYYDKEGNKFEENQEYKPWTEAERQYHREVMLRLINEERARLGSQPLVLDDKLNEVSEFKAQDIYETGVFSHTGTQGDPKDLAKKFGVSPYIGENISSGRFTGDAMYRGFYNSPQHYANMINPEFRKLGLGFKEMDGPARFLTTSEEPKNVYRPVYTQIKYDEARGVTIKKYGTYGKGYWHAMNLTN